jgi:hypothetical protein
MHKKNCSVGRSWCLSVIQVQTLNGLMEINSLSVKELTWQHSKRCEGNMALSNFSLGKTFVTCIVGRRFATKRF